MAFRLDPAKPGRYHLSLVGEAAPSVLAPLEDRPRALDPAHA